MEKELLEELKRLKAIAEIGLLYCNNEYDRERYTELQEMSYRLLGSLSGHHPDTLRSAFPPATDYPTAKVDIRGLLLSPDRKILMVRESIDGKWSLPGGWADVGLSPKEVIIREFREETGLEISPKRLLAVFDKKKHPHPPQPFYTYKMAFYCEAISSQMQKGFDVLDLRYFPVEDLPPLSEDRILKSQIELLYQKALSGDEVVYID